MAAIPHWSASNTSTVTTTSTSVWSDVVSLTLTAGQQTASAKYLILWNTALGGSLIDADTKARVTQAGSARAEINLEPKEVSSPQDRDQQSGFFVFTAAGTPADTEFKIQLQSGNSSHTASAFNGYLIIIELPSGSADDEVTGEQTLASSTTYTDVTGVSLSGLSGDHLLLASVEYNTAHTTTTSVDVGINVDGSISNALIGGMTDTGNHPSMIVAARATISSTAKVQFRQTQSTSFQVAVRNIRLVAIPAGAFRNLWTEILGSDSSGTNSSYTNALSETQTASAGDHLLLGMIGLHANNTLISSYGRLTSGGSQVDEHIREGVSNTSPRGTPAGAIARIENYSAGSRTWGIDRKSETTSATTRILAGSAIVVIDLEAGSAAASADPDDAGHAHAADAAGATAHAVAAPAEAGHGHAADQATATARAVASPADAGHAHAADQAGAAFVPRAAPNDASHGHAADAATATARAVSSPADAAHAHAADAAAATAHATAAPAEAGHGHAADQAAATARAVASPDETDHGHAADPATATARALASPADAAHGHAAESAVATASGGAAQAFPADAGHGHAADATSATAHAIASPAEAGHGHAAEQAGATARAVSAPEKATHGHAADSATAAGRSAAAPADAAHAHAADQAAATARALASPADAAHGHAGEAAAATARAIAGPADAGHGHAADLAVASAHGEGEPLGGVAIDLRLPRLAGAVGLTARRAGVGLAARRGTVGLPVAVEALRLPRMPLALRGE